MINTLVMSGNLMRVDITPPKGKDPKRGPTAMILLQYGPSRERTEQPVQFINMALVRVPHFVLEKLKTPLVVGATLDVVAHIQGVSRPMSGMGEAYLANEIVADRIQVADTVAEEDGTPEA